MNKCSRFDNLPKGIFAEIMSRLPVDSLMRCKCLNKSWYFDIRYLIKDSKFVAKSLRYAEASPTALLVCEPHRTLREMAQGYPVTLMLNAQLIDNVGGDICCITQGLNFPRSLDMFQEKCLLRVYHCNGLVCLTSDYKNITLCNPALCEYKTFHPKTYISNKTSDICGMGFGSDSEASNYKIVRLLTNMRAEVFTLGTDYSWREIKTSLRDERNWNLNGCYVYFNGHCLWLMHSKPNKVLCFNVCSETFHTIALPAEFLGFRWAFTLCNESACLIAWGRITFMWRVVVKSETRTGGCNYFLWNCRRTASSSGSRLPLTLWKSNELLVKITKVHMAIETKISSYNLCTLKLRKLSLGRRLGLVFYCGHYVKSLVYEPGCNIWVRAACFWTLKLVLLVSRDILVLYIVPFMLCKYSGTVGNFERHFSSQVWHASLCCNLQTSSF